MIIHVGTENSLKVEAVRAAFKVVFPEHRLKVIGKPVITGVPSQPFEEEVVAGAINRAQKALQGADFGVGIEAGLVKLPGAARYLNLQICAIIDRSDKLYIGSGPGFELPPLLVTRLQSGSTLNREMSYISGIPQIKEKEGAIGYLSKGAINRFAATYEAVLMALIPYMRHDLFSR